ncbi:MAG TPA: response regulator [Thermoanaerobaculia bacterium]|nr:response regulator [Thermoanaerobaculia bacterium]
MGQRAILVVEDDDTTRNLLRALLRRRGAAVETAGDGERAIELLRGGEFDTVILDLMLPKRNGFEVAGALFTLEPQPKLIVVSSMANHFTDRFPAGTVMLQKPLDIEQLDAAITNTSTPAPQFL